MYMYQAYKRMRDFSFEFHDEFFECPMTTDGSNALVPTSYGDQDR